MRKAILLMSLAAVGCSAQHHSTRSELYFGLTDHGKEIPSAEFDQFVDEVITPRFPDGFSIVKSTGQYRDRSGKIEHEPSEMVILLHDELEPAADAKLNEICREYAKRFNQECVLKVDAPASAEFIGRSP